MQRQLSILTGGLIAFCLPLPVSAQATPTPITTKAVYGPKVEWDDITDVQITNLQGESLGRIADLALDLSNGRVVEVLVVSGQTLGLGGKTVAMPPQALHPDMQNKTYRIDMSTAMFKAAPAFDLRKWAESTQPTAVAAAYRYFGQVPNFSVPGEAAGESTAAGQPLASLGFIQRTNKLLNMPVDNLKGERLGRLQSLALDVPKGRILNVVVSAKDAETPLKYSTVIPPTMFSFNAAHDTLLLDVSRVTYGKEPHIVFEDGGSEQTGFSRQQNATGPHTNAALMQGTSSRDINTTDQIYKSIQTQKLDPEELVEVGTKEGRVTVRGSVSNQATKVRIGAIAIALVSLENVDNQIVVIPPPPAATK